jgi:hypothetical protein
MATNPTNSTTVNIRNLPEAQLAVDTDYFILQTNNGTQIISYKDLNVVKTDIDGNANVVGVLSGGDAKFTGRVAIASLTASQYFTTGGLQGFTQPIPGLVFYDSLTIVNGLVTSAVQTSVNYRYNPLYTSLYTQLTAASANLVTKSTYKNIFDYSNVVQISNGASTSSPVTWTVPADVVTSGRINAGSFTIMPGDGSSLAFTLSTIPYISNCSANGTSVTFTLNAGMIVPSSPSASFRVRMLVTY